MGFVRYVDGIRLQVSEEILSQTPEFSADSLRTPAIVFPTHGDAF